MLFLLFKMAALDGIEGYKQMYKENFTLFRWLPGNFIVLSLNYLISVVARKISYTVRRRECFYIIACIQALLAYFYGLGFCIILRFSQLSLNYFNREETYVWHQYVTFKMIEMFRAPLIFYLTCVFGCVCLWKCNLIIINNG